MVTTSFHGVAFSLIYHKPFIAILPNDSKVAGCIPVLLSKVRLLNNVILETEVISNRLLESAKAMDYAAVDVELDSFRRKSFAFLESI